MFFLFEPFSKRRDWSSSRKNLYLKPVRYLTHRSLTSPLLASIVKVSRCSAIGGRDPSVHITGVNNLFSWADGPVHERGPPAHACCAVHGADLRMSGARPASDW